MSRASDNLKTNQRQLDMDGVEVGVSRQAVHETLAEYTDMLEALKAVVAIADRKTVEFDRARAVIAKATGNTTEG
jgi:hypothetical protein